MYNYVYTYLALIIIKLTKQQLNTLAKYIYIAIHNYLKLTAQFLEHRRMLIHLLLTVSTT